MATGSPIYGNFNTGLLNDYIIRPKNLTEYTALRGVTDFTQLAQFDQFETGYSQLYVLRMPRFLEKLASMPGNDYAANLVNSFKHMLEFEFRGLSGLPNITSNTFTISDGSNEQQIINDVVRDTSVELSSTFYERRGSLITKFLEYYLTGIKDPISKAKTYHGLIATNELAPGIENEVGTFMYVVTDNTYLRIERAFLLANVQFTQSETSMYDSEKGQIQNKEVSVGFRCFPIWGDDIDRAAKKLVEYTNGVSFTSNGKVVGKQGDYSQNAVDANAYAEKGVDGKEVNSFGNTIYESANYHWGMYSNDKYKSTNLDTNRLYDQLGGDKIFTDK